MERRKKILLFAAVGMGGFYLLWLIGIQPVIDDMKTLDGQISAIKKALHLEKSYLKRQTVIETEWDSTVEEIEDPDRETQKDQFDLFVRSLMDRTIESKSRLPTLTPLNQKEQKGDFLETSVEVKNAHFGIQEWIRFLVNLENESDFLRVRRFALRSRFDRPDNVLAVDMKLSTIEYFPVEVKSNSRKRGSR